MASRKPEYKVIEYTPELEKTLVALTLNGYNESMLREVLSCGAVAYKMFLRKHPGLRQNIKNAKEEAVQIATNGISKLAEGFREDEITYTQDLKKQDAVISLFDKMADLEPRLEDFRKQFEKLVSVGVKKRVSKYYPPNKDAAKLILEAHNPEIWDLDARRKMIPQVKINVTVDEKRVYKPKEVEADVEIIN